MRDAIHVFAGPSLPPSLHGEHADLVFHPPAAQGDVYAVVESEPLAVGLIDGVFEHTPAVWHKELLWAMAQGVHLLGASSMGALRAVELGDFGAVGVGRVYRDFADGTLGDDDEVALVHGDASSDYACVSDAMVNIRATLAHAVAQRVLARPSADALSADMKALFYPDRNYARLAQAGRDRLPRRQAEKFADWLRDPGNRRDVKRADALALLDELRRLRAARPAPLRVAWTFQHTDAWERATGC